MWLKPETVEDHKACQLIVDRFKAGKGLDIGKTWDDHVIIQMPDNPEQEIR